MAHPYLLGSARQFRQSDAVWKVIDYSATHVYDFQPYIYYWRFDYRACSHWAARWPPGRQGRRCNRFGGHCRPLRPRCAAIAGYSVHANVCVPAHDHMRLERLCRYASRAPVATERLSLLPDSGLLYRLKRHRRDGATHMIFEPLELVEKLAALVPPPRFNLARYHGILAPSAAWRPLVIPESDRNQLLPPDTENPQKKRACRPRNYSWSELLKRLLLMDVLQCPRCGRRMRILAAIHPPDAIRWILECLGLPSRPPPVARAIPARAPDEHASN